MSYEAGTARASYRIPMNDAEYHKLTRTRLLAEGRIYAAKCLDEEYARAEFLKAQGRIPLRAFYVSFPCGDRSGLAGIALSDGRLIVSLGIGNIGSFSSEAVMQKHLPGAAIHWHPDADAAINGDA